MLERRGPHGVDGLLNRRGFATPLAHVPWTMLGLLRGGFELAHAFSLSDAVAALGWRRITGRPVVVTLTEPPARERLADRRLRLWSLERVLDEADAVVAADDAVRDAMLRWLAVDAPVIPPGDGAANKRLYEALRK